MEDIKIYHVRRVLDYDIETKCYSAHFYLHVACKCLRQIKRSCFEQLFFILSFIFRQVSDATVNLENASCAFKETVIFYF